MRTCPAGHPVSLAVARLIYPRTIDREQDAGAVVCWRCGCYRRAGGSTWHAIEQKRHEREWKQERKAERRRDDNDR